MDANKEGAVWIRVEVGLSRHRKVRHLMGALDVGERRQIVGGLVGFWEQVRLTAADGNLAGWLPGDLAEAMGFGALDGERVLAAMLEVGFIEHDGSGDLVVHDWFEINGVHIKDAQRKKAQRDAKSAERPRNVRGRSMGIPSDGRTDGRTEDSGVASQRAPRRVRSKAPGKESLPNSRAALYALHGVQDLAGRLIDEYLGLGASDEEPWQLQARAAILADPAWRETVGTLRVPQEALEQAAGNRAKVLDLVQGIVDKKRIADPAAPAPAAAAGGPERVHVGMVYEIARKLGKNGQHVALQLTQRIFNAGVRSPAVLTAVARHYVDHHAGIRSPFAYYSPGGDGFEFIRMRVGAEASIAEHQAIERATRDWLNPPTPAQEAVG